MNMRTHFAQMRRPLSPIPPVLSKPPKILQIFKLRRTEHKFPAPVFCPLTEIRYWDPAGQPATWRERKSAEISRRSSL